MKDETFSHEQVLHAIETFLQYGEQSYCPSGAPDAGHRGYFSGSGWAARCLRWHFEQLKAEQEKRKETSNAE